jgi:uncharacterized protein YcaQ
VDKRRYGYYVLPVLYGDRFIARFEPGFDKKRGVLTVKNWWWETGIAPSEPLQSDLVECLRGFQSYLGASRLEAGRQPRESADLEWLRRLI